MAYIYLFSSQARPGPSALPGPQLRAHSCAAVDYMYLPDVIYLHKVAYPTNKLFLFLMVKNHHTVIKFIGTKHN